MAATESELLSAENTLGIRLPQQLRRYLLKSDGMDDEYGFAIVWPLERIIRDNQLFRTNADLKELYMPFDCLLFFAEAGNGDQFALPIQSGEIRRNDVFLWNHEDDSRTWVAPSLETYIEWRLAGKLSQ